MYQKYITKNNFKVVGQVLELKLFQMYHVEVKKEVFYNAKNRALIKTIFQILQSGK